MKIGIVVFPGSNCDRDVRWATEGILKFPTTFLWHETTDLKGYDAIVLPGGFSYGDYLRCGAIARFSPVLESLISFVEYGGKVIGICNGFQVLTELGLLPGALTRNKNLNFICTDSQLTVASTRTKWFSDKKQADKMILPIAHGEGRYQCSEDTLSKLQDEDSIALRYLDNLNGSVNAIAGITNLNGNVLGLMPHPERACDPRTGGLDGIQILKALIQ